MLSFRAWRWSILKDSDRSMDNFITYQTYISVEINAHSFINFYRSLRNKNRLDLFAFLPLLQSQPCEDIFRVFRSLTTLNWTDINFNILEILYRTRRVNEMSNLEERLGKASKFLSLLHC